MKIDGKVIATSILDKLKQDVEKLREKNIIPHLVIVLVGNDPASESYVKQKVIRSEAIGAKVTLLRFPESVSQEELETTMQQLNNDNNVHGVIVQRPLPPQLDDERINKLTTVNKDIDAFLPNSPFTMPLAAAVVVILEKIYQVYSSSEVPPKADESRSSNTNSSRFNSNNNFIHWLQSQSIAIIGKGSTGGGPVIELLKQKGINPIVIDSKTQDRENKLKKADIIIAAVGKQGILKVKDIKKGAILVCVGMGKGEDGKLHGDYEPNEVEHIASYYTPVPGGVGPVNVAMLLKNLIQAAKMQSKQ